MKPLTMTVFLTALLSIFAVSASAQLMEAEWSAPGATWPGRSTPYFDLANNNGMNIGISFTWKNDDTMTKAARLAAAEQIDHVKWELKFGNGDDAPTYNSVSSEFDSDTGLWFLCDEHCPGFAFKGVGTWTIKASAIYREGPDNGTGPIVVAVLGYGTFTIRIRDTTPAPPRVPRRRPDPPKVVDYCFGTPRVMGEDGCDEIVGTPYWNALTDLCPKDNPLGVLQKQGAVFSLGTGLYLQCARVRIVSPE